MHFQVCDPRNIQHFSVVDAVIESVPTSRGALPLSGGADSGQPI